MDKNIIRILREEIDRALEEVAKEHNVSIRTGNARFTQTSVTFKLEVAEKQQDGSTVDPLKEAFLQNYKLFGFKKSDLGKEFIIRENKYILVGIRLSAHKYPVVMMDKHSKTNYKFTIDAVLKR